MVKERDLEVVTRFKERLSKSYPVKKLILFGSRATGKIHKWSDFDILIVSSKFGGIRDIKRIPNLYNFWKENEPVDFLAYTPEEFNRLKRQITIVKKAVDEGVEI